MPDDWRVTNREPTDAEWVTRFLSLSRAEQEQQARWARQAHVESVRCVVENHRGRGLTVENQRLRAENQRLRYAWRSARRRANRLRGSRDRFASLWARRLIGDPVR